MENQEKTGDEKGCCSKSKCCGGKGLAALALLLVGGVAGYFGGKCCTAKHASATAPVESPAK